MADFTMTGSSSAPDFNPNSFNQNKDTSVTANNNTGGSVTLYIYYSSNGSSGWASSTTLFTSGVSSVSVSTGQNQAVGTISNSASTTGAYLLSPSSTPPTVFDDTSGNNVKVNVGS